MNKNFTKEQIIKKIKSEDLLFKNLDAIYKNNINIALEAIKKRGYNFQYVSDKLKDNLEVAIVAVQKDGHALNFANKKLKENIRYSVENLKKDLNLTREEAVNYLIHKEMVKVEKTNIEVNLNKPIKQSKKLKL